MHLIAAETDKGKRLDHFLQERLPQYSRSRLQDWIKNGRVTVSNVAQKSSYQLRGTELVDVQPAELAPLKAVAEDLPLHILYQDADVIAVNKPAGVVVHAGAGNHTGTLTNALVHHFGTLSTVGGELRPGIVHRIDRFTSGVLVVARTDAAHRSLALAVCQANRGEGLSHSVCMARRRRRPGGSTPQLRARSHPAHSHDYPAGNRTHGIDHLPRSPAFPEVHLAGSENSGTGRTHQIRVHLASIGHPVAGDKLYGAPAGSGPRYFLHAASIAFDSPASAERITVQAPLPADLEQWLAELQ